MNIVIINHYAGSDKYGMEFRPLYLGRELVKKGHNVSVIAASYSHLRKIQPDVKKDFDEEYIDGVRYIYFKTPKYKKNDHRRLFNVLTFCFKLKKNADKLAEMLNPDAVVGSSTYPQDVNAAKKIAAFSGAKTVYEIHDLWPLSLMELYGFGHNNPLIKVIAKAERFAYENADTVISILSDADKHIKQLGYEVDYHWVPNGIDLKPRRGAGSPELIRIKSLIDEYKSNGKFILMYLGGFARANALDELAAAAGEMPNVQVIMVGDGALKPELEKYISKNGAGNVTFTGAVGKDMVQDVLSLADCLYIGAKKSGLYEYGIGMNKLFDYMLSARPIICGIKAPGNPVELSGCGVIIEPESADEIIAAADKMITAGEKNRLEMGIKGRDYVLKNHTYDKLAEKFLDALD